MDYLFILTLVLICYLAFCPVSSLFVPLLSLISFDQQSEEIHIPSYHSMRRQANIIPKTTKICEELIILKHWNQKQMQD